jgi:DNA helicase HerA-like ATPase
LFSDGKLVIAHADTDLCLLPAMCNRHGLIAGATGTGKTVTLKTIASSLSDAGVPCFLADVKGDVSGVAIAGEASDKLTARLHALGIDDMDFHGCPTRFWDVYGEGGTPVRATVSQMGSACMARILGLTDVQTGVLSIVFHAAADQGLALIDLKDLRAMVASVGQNAATYRTTYGNVSTASIGAIQRSLLSLEDAGGNVFFGEPALDINDWLATDDVGHGYLNVLDCTRLVQSPLLYSTFLLWMLTSLYEALPEVGDLEKPKVCFFFDEAHLLFDDASKALVQKVEQVVRLIRSKGVGVFFITQVPSDVPDSVLAQLGNRVQHALRAYTPSDQRAVRAAADSFRANPAFDTAEAIGELATGEALVSFLDADGKPGVVERAKVIAPCCSMGACADDVREKIRSVDALAPKYLTEVDRPSAYESLSGQSTVQPQTGQTAETAPVADGTNPQGGTTMDDQTQPTPAAPTPAAVAAAPVAASAAAVAAPTAKEQAETAKAQAEAAKAQAEAEIAQAKAEKAKADAEAAEARADKAKQSASVHQKSDAEKLAGSVATSMSRSIGTSVARGLMDAIKKSI